MSDITLDKGAYFASPITDWYRERPFKVAFALSVLIHAALIAFIPGFRSVPIETPRVLNVEILPTQAPPAAAVREKPAVPQKIVEPKIEAAPEPVVPQPPPEPKPEPVIQQPKPEPRPEPVARQTQPELPPVPRAEIIRSPRVEPTPEFVVPRPELRPEPKTEPRLQSRPEPRIEPRPEPPTVARVEPRPEPPPVARVEPRPEPPPVARVEPRPEPHPMPIVEPRPVPRIEPRSEIRPETGPVPREMPPPVVHPRAEPVVAAPAPARPAPAPVVTPTAPVVAAPQPNIADETRERALIAQYQQIISARIKQHEEYPVVAKRRHWEGTAVVQLRLTPEGKVTDISIIEKSGYDVLDEAAVKMIRKASPLPPPPEGLRGRDHTVLVPIRFKLDS